jgi:hypothetical protein
VLDAYRDLIDELLAAPTEIRRRVSERAVAPLPAPAARLLAELRDRDLAVTRRLQSIIQERNAYLPLWRSAEVVVSDEPTLLDEIERARGDLVSLLMNLTLKEWENTATDEIAGEITLADEVERHVEFDEAQRAAIERALQ